MWHPAVYGFNGDDASMIAPLHSMKYEQWWFRGKRNDKPRARVTLNAGGTTILETACERQHTTFGGAAKSKNHPCPTDPPAAHTALGKELDKNALTGCALAIAYKSDAMKVNPEDFVVFSVQKDCVFRRFTHFKIPKLPKCPGGKCVCAWFWQGKVSGDEMVSASFVSTL